MTYRRLAIPILALAASLVAGAVAIAPAAGASGSQGGETRIISASGTTTFSPTPTGADADLQAADFGQATVNAAGGPGSNHTGVNRSRSIEHGAPPVTGVPVTAGVGVSSTGPLSLVSTFDGLNHRQQRLANNGNQFSLEPPDQGLCANSSVEMEIINDVMRVYSPTGAPVQGVEDLNSFFGYQPAVIRSKPRVFGQFVTDPSCFFDLDTQRWFADVLTIEVFPKNDPANHISGGDFTGANHLDLAVSKTSDPTGAWTIYRVPVQDDSTQNTPNHHCKGIAPYGQQTVPTNPNACLGDYPHLGADANGVYLTTNEYSFFGVDFHGAQIYAFSKSALASGANTVAVTQFDTHMMDNGNSGFTIWPATAPAGLNSTANNGTEYFMSSNAADEAHGDGSTTGPRRSNQLLVWSLTNTQSLGSNTVALNLSHTTLTTGLYVVPARSEQKAGETPLIDCLNKNSCAVNFLLGFKDPFEEFQYPLDSNDTRMQQVVFADGKLWGALDTAVNASANTRAGVEWFVVNPNASGGPALVNSGYLAVSQNNVIYPAIAVTPSGKGVMAFTLVGRDFFPSAAFASIDSSGVGAVQVAAEGAGPADGFSGTAVFNAPNPARPRWGDYGAAVVVGNNIWIASEYIGQTCDLSTYVATGASCGGTRTALANWDTRITEVNPA